MNTPDTNLEATPAPSPAPTEERVRKVYVRDLREKEGVHTVFKVTRKLKHTARSGKVFLALTLGDRTGEVEGRIFENVDAVEGSFNDTDYVLVRGNVISYQGKPQVVIEQLEKLDPGPLDPKEFEVPAAPAPGAEGARSEGTRSVAQIYELVQRVHDPHVKALLLAFLDDPTIAEPLTRAPAAKGIHHAYRGGLADHILSVMRLAHRIADHYPMADRDLLTAGALLHDILKVREITAERGGYEYTDEGRLVGHLVMTAQMIREKAARIPGFPALLEQHLTHIVISHHGRLEWGSPKLPMTLEAYLVHEIDSIDSRVASWLELMAKDPNEKWTENTKLYDRHLWKGTVPTSRNRSPVEGQRGPRRERGGKGKGHGHGHGGEGREQRHGPEASSGAPAATATATGGPPERRPSEGGGGRPERKPREDRENRPPRERREREKSGGGGGAAPKDLTFKPFAVLTQEAGGGAAAPAPEATPPETPPATNGSPSGETPST